MARSIARDSASTSPGRNEQARLAVGADHLGHRAAGGAHDGDAARHRFDGREREALVERRHARDFGLGVQLDDPLGGDAAHELDRAGEPEALDQRRHLALRLGLSDDDEVRVVTLGADLRQRLEERSEALHRDVGAGGGHEATGDALDLGTRSEDVRVDTDGDDVEAVGRDAHLLDDVAARRLRHGDVAGDVAGDVDLHVEEAVPAAQVEPAPGVRGVGEIERAIDGDRVMEGGDDRPAVLRHHLLDAPAEALVVVDEVEVAAAVGQQAPGPERERVRLGEARPAHDGELGDVDPRS